MRHDLGQMEAFLTVMELHTVTAAAARLNLSKSVVSKRIADFEGTIGTALFRRHAGRILATDAARRLEAQLRPAYAALLAATDIGSAGADAPLRGALAISAPISFGTMFLSPVLATFAAANPGLRLRVDYDDRLRDLAREGFDLGIRVGEARDGALRFRKLAEDHQVVVASADYLARAGTPATPADLQRHETLSYSHMADAQLWRFRCDGRLTSVAVSSRVTMNNGEGLRDMAIAGLGIAILPAFIVADAIARGALVRILARHEARRLPVLAVWPPVAPMPRELRALIDHLVLAFRESAAPG